MNGWAPGVIAFLAIMISCFFAACSGALRIYSRAKLDDLLEEKGKQHRLDAFVQREPKLLLLAGMLRSVMNMLVLLAFVWMFSQTFESAWLNYLSAFLVAGTLISVVAVAIPVSWAQHHPEKLLATNMPILIAITYLLLPMAHAMQWFDPIVRRLSGSEKQAASGEDLLTEEILSVVEDHEEQTQVDDSQKDMLEGVIELRSTTADQIMTPRTDIKGLEYDASLADVKDAIIQLGHSRIPVYRENLDDIVGILYAKDMIQYIGQTELPTWDLTQIVRKPLLVPESKSVNALLTEFKTTQIHMAIIVDEYGGTAGLVTIEDILEEIVGEIEDEYEPGQKTPSVTRVDDKSFEVDARMRMDDLNDELNLELPEEDDYDTVGGFVFAILGHIPATGEQFDFQNMRFSVIQAQRTKVIRVGIVQLDSDAVTEIESG